MYYSLHYSWILLHPIYNKVTSVCSLGEEYAKSGKLHSFLSHEKRMKFFGSLIICMNRNTQRLAHFCIFDFVHISVVEVFTCHTPDKHVVACSGSSVNRPFR